MASPLGCAEVRNGGNKTGCFTVKFAVTVGTTRQPVSKAAHKAPVQTSNKKRCWRHRYASRLGAEKWLFA